MKIKAHTEALEDIGNELADEIAKRYRLRSLWNIHQSNYVTYSTTLSQINEETRHAWKSDYLSPSPDKNKQSRFRKFVFFTNKKFVRLMSQLTRAQSCLMMEVLSEHMHLNHFIFRKNYSESRNWRAFDLRGACRFCGKLETVNHVLFVCPLYNKERQMMIDKIRRIWRDFKFKNHFNDQYIIYGWFFYQHIKEKRLVDDELQLKLWRLVIQFFVSIKPYLKSHRHKER
jgi:hypothetical protein